MATRLKIDLTARSIEVEGEDGFVQSVYRELRGYLREGESANDAPSDTLEQENFKGLLDEARISASWSEFHRAYDLFKQALQAAPKSANVSVLAEIFEGVDLMCVGIEQVKRELPELEAAVNTNPESAQKRFYLALALSKLGRDNEALAEYESALSNTEDLCAGCFRDLWNNIGWFHFRRKNFREALKWFEQSYQIATSDEGGAESNCALAIENKILCFSALSMRGKQRQPRKSTFIAAEDYRGRSAERWRIWGSTLMRYTWSIEKPNFNDQWSGMPIAL